MRTARADNRGRAAQALSTLTTETVGRILNELDAASAPEAALAGKGGREEAFSYRVGQIQVETQPAGCKPRSVSVHGRSLGRDRLAAVAPERMAADVPCQVELPTLSGTTHRLRGRIDHRRRLQQKVPAWDVRIRFERPLDLVRYVPELWRARVLVADDSKTVCCLMRKMLTDCRADVTCALNGREAIEVARQQRFDLVLLDVEMPELTGIEAVQALRDEGYLWPIVMVTSFRDEESRYASMEAGCDAFTIKPPTEEDLGSLVRRMKPPPLISTRADDPDSFELIDAFVAELRASVTQMEAAFKEADSAVLESVARQIRSSATACGFAELATYAERVGSTIEAGFPQRDLRRAVMLLAQHCQAARPATNFDAF